MQSHRIWVISLAPGIIIAGLIVGTGRLEFGLGVLSGTVLAVGSQGVLTLLVHRITTPGNWKRTTAAIAAQFVKYLLIGLAVYVAVHHPHIDSIGMFVGITLAVAGFVAGQVMANPVCEYSDRQSD